MADEVKKEEKNTCCCGGGKAAGSLVKVVIGIAFIVLAGYLLYTRHWWGAYTWPLIKGCAAPVLIFAGLITLAIAKE